MPKRKTGNYAVDQYAARVRHSNTGTEYAQLQMQPPIFGISSYHVGNKAVVAFPVEETAMARTQRLHEAMHLRFTGNKRSHKYPKLAFEAIEDVKLHFNLWDGNFPLSVHRDAMCAALQELRSITQKKLHYPISTPLEAMMHNIRLCMACRATAIALRTETLFRLEPREKVLKLVDKCFPFPVARIFTKIITHLTKAGRYSEAMEEFTKLMVDETAPERPYDNKTHEAFGKKVPESMKIVELKPRNQPCSNTTVKYKVANTGFRIRAKKLAQAAIAPISGVFKRRLRIQGGTVCIDGSGSMHMDNKVLHKLCQTAPAATVAYYHGEDDKEAVVKTYGSLQIYAKDNKRYSGVLPRRDGNGVDFEALTWLLQQPEPRIIVTDGGYCGGVEGNPEKAITLLNHASMSGKVKWLKTVEEALAYFNRIKGKLPSEVAKMET